MKQDKVFTQPIEKKFEFDQAVASVFDDMLWLLYCQIPPRPFCQDAD